MGVVDSSGESVSGMLISRRAIRCIREAVASDTVTGIECRAVAIMK